MPISNRPEGLLINSRQAAMLLAVSERTLWSYTAPRGPIPAVRIGNAVRYSPAALNDYVRSQVTQGEEAP